MSYVIYHIFGVKVGCTVDYPKRCYAQGFKDGEFGIVEELDESVGEQFAWERECSYQIAFGYKIDNLSYINSNKGRRICVEQGKNSFQNKEYVRELGKIGGKKSIASQLERGVHNSQTGKNPLFNLSKKQRQEAQKKSIAIQLANGTHVGGTRFQLQTSAQHAEAGRIGGKISAKGPNHFSKRIATCPHCGFTGKCPSIFSRHFDKCKMKPR